MTLCYRISDLSYIWCHTRASFHFGWGLEISKELHDRSHLWSMCRDDDLFAIVMMIPQWSLSGVIQLGTHFSALRCHLAPLSERCILAWWAWCCYGFGWPRLHIYWCMIRRHLNFLTCHTFDAILWHIFTLDRDLQILAFAWSPLVTRCVGLMIRFHSVMTLRWTFPWVVSSGSHFMISLRFLDGVISGSWTLTSSFHRITCQIFYASPSSYSWVIRTDRVHLMPYWGIFPSFSYGDGRSVMDLLQFSSFDREISYLLHGSLFWRYSSRWAFSVAWCSGCDCLAIHDSSVEGCIEITVITLSDHFLWGLLIGSFGLIIPTH